MTGLRAYAAYNKTMDFLSLESIGISMHGPRNWIDRTYISGMENFEIVRVKITIDRARKSKRRRKSD